jgi:18S rRNA (guanine1575-N7)-methyltransferase
MVGIQREITERAVELLKLDHDTDAPCYILDVGCGSGLSGQVLEERGHVWVGCDISREGMLTVAQERMRRQAQEAKKKSSDRNTSEAMDEEGDEDEDDGDEVQDDGEDILRESTGDLLHHDMGTGLPFRPATFDACISISALQWLCYSNSSQQNPRRRLTRFFSSLYTVLKRGGRAVLQFYPETAEQAILISETATACGFSGGVVVDYPNSAKAKKHYLVLSFDRSAVKKKGVIEAAAQQQQQHVQVSSMAAREQKKPQPIRKKKGVKTKEWILHKKEAQRTRGKNVRPDTKYTARRRPTKF